MVDGVAVGGGRERSGEECNRCFTTAKGPEMRMRALIAGCAPSLFRATPQVTAPMPPGRFEAQ